MEDERQSMVQWFLRRLEWNAGVLDPRIRSSDEVKQTHHDETPPWEM
jgi:hypothetical protein